MTMSTVILQKNQFLKFSCRKQKKYARIAFFLNTQKAIDNVKLKKHLFEAKRKDSAILWKNSVAIFPRRTILSEKKVRHGGRIFSSENTSGRLGNHFQQSALAAQSLQSDKTGLAWNRRPERKPSLLHPRRKRIPPASRKRKET